MKHILLVDDDRSVLSFLQRVLYDYRVSVAHDGDEALAQLATAGHIDLLVTDFMMPSMTGDELIGRGREQQPGLKVLLITGHSNILAAEQLGWWAAEPHLVKPFRSTELRAAVRRLVGSGSRRPWPLRRRDRNPAPPH